MGYYKIKNVTNDLGKRHGKVNTTQTIEFKDIISANSIAIAPGAEITVEANYLPITAQKLRTEGLITIVEIDKNTYQKMLNTQETRKHQEMIAKVQPAKVGDSEDKVKKYKQKNK